MSRADSTVIATAIILVASVVLGVGNVFYIPTLFQEPTQEPEKVDYNTIQKMVDYCAFKHQCYSLSFMMQVPNDVTEENIELYLENNPQRDWRVELDTSHGLRIYHLESDEELPTGEEFCYMGIDLSFNANCEFQVLIDKQNKIIELLENEQ